jgi:2-oxoglutarate dehydrogenase E2 component (dihydrolipoamide succinyltransferase)
MAAVELIMPKMGESIMEATVLNWLKSEGDTIEIDEPVLEIATDKVDSEVPAHVAGTITKILFNEGDVVPVGEAVAIIETEGEGGATAPSGGGQAAATPEPAPQKQPEPEAVQAAATRVQEAVATASAPSNGHGGGRFYSPLVLNIARSENISMNELENLPGSGQNGRVTKKDILAYVKNRGADQQAAPVTVKETPAAQPQQAAQVAQNAQPMVAGDVEIIEMDRMRKLIAHHMVNSVQTSPHVTSFVEADVTNIVNWRKKNKDEFERRYGEKLTFTPIFIEAIVKAIRDFPEINISVDGDKIIRKKNINVGMAAALPNGNLIVPVIKNADQYNLAGLSSKVNDLAGRARQNKLKPDEIEGGSYTISNVGTFGNVMGTPIINQPQVAIMAVGAIRKKPAVIETAEGDFIGIRHMMFLSHSYDHRVVDGFLGGSFVRRMADYLESFDPNRDL